jgi:heterodisulfide reductase subunit A
MQSLKLAHLVKEKLPEADVFEYYIDMRAFGKGYEEFYNRIAAEGIFVVRGKTATIEEKGNKLHLRTEDILNDALIDQQVDMVVLSVGLEPALDTGRLAGMLGISQDDNGWFREANLLTEPASTEHPGIHIAGVCEGPKDIPDTVTQAATAAARVLHSIEAHAEVIAG